MTRTFNLGLALIDADSEPWRSLAAGARAEAARQGVELAVPLVQGSDPAERQANQLRELVKRQVDLAFLVGGGGPLLSAAIDEAANAQVPLASLSSGTSVEKLVFKVAPDQYAVGRLQSTCLGTAVHGQGSVALLTGPSTNPVALQQAQGFREGLAQRFPRVELVVVQSAELDRPAASDVVAGWLRRWPSLAGLAAGDEATALGALDALYEAGRLGRIQVAATRLSGVGERSLMDGGIRCSVVQQAVAEGEAAVRNAIAYLSSQPFERNVKSPPLVVTTENVALFDWGPVRAP